MEEKIKRNEHAIAVQRPFVVILVGLILGLSLYIGIKPFDAEQAKLALGETYDLSDGWKVTYDDGTVEENASMPIKIPAGKRAAALERTVNEDFSGLAMTLYGSNCGLQVYMDDMPIFVAGSGTGDVRMKGDGSESGEKAPTDIMERLADINSEDAVGEVIFDLPENIKEGSDLCIILGSVDKNTSIVVQSASVAKRDAAIISILGNSVFAFICIVLIIMAAVIFIVLDVLRAISGRRLRGLWFMAFVTIDVIIICFNRTGIFYFIFDNRVFFQTLQTLCFVLLPIPHLMFFRRGFRLHFPRLMDVMLWSAIILSGVQVALMVFKPGVMTVHNNIPVIIEMAVVVILVIMLYKWRAAAPKFRTIGQDVVALICLGVALAFVCLENSFAGVQWLSYPRALLTAIYFGLVGGQHSVIMFQEYQRSVKDNERKLQEQVDKAEAARAEAEEARVEAESAKDRAEEAREEADAANQAKTRFLANMSHEIRTPINAVLGMDEMILRETKDKGVKGYAMDIRAAGHTLLSLINEILDYSKIESGKMEIVPADYDLPTIINNLVNMTTARAKGKDLEFITEIDENLPMKLYGDDVRVRQVITNILTNAVKYTPEGKVWLRMSGVLDGEDVILHVEIEDTGIGIKEEDIPKLFVEYERIEESRNRNIEGTGLGMNITLQLLAMMGSRLQVESVYGKGSKFFFDLRQKVLDETPIGDFKSAVEKAADEFEYTESFIAPDAHVLVVDDNSMNRKVFMSLLKATEIQVDDAGGGPEAISLAMQNHYDIIFMDHMMPDMDGIQTMKHIKSITDGPNADTPIIVLTANAVSGAKESYMAEGFDGFMSKPVVADKLEKLIGETLPKEMLKPAPEREDKQTDSNPMPEDLPSIEGLDWPFAWLHLPGEEMLIDTVKEFYALLPVHGKKLAGFYEQLPSAEGFEGYRIQVHGMKSSAATIGIVPLAGMAKILEFAAKDLNETIIRQVHPVFMAEWDSYLEKMRGAFGLGEEDDSDKEDADPGKTRAYLEMLRLAMEDYDVDKADELMATLKNYRYADGITEKIGELGGAVADLDSDLCNEIVADIMNLL